MLSEGHAASIKEQHGLPASEAGNLLNCQVPGGPSKVDRVCAPSSGNAHTGSRHRT